MQLDIQKREAKQKRWHVWKAPRRTTIEDVVKYLEGMKFKLSVDMLVVDYLEQLSPIKDRGDARAELNDTLGEAKQFAESYSNNRGLWFVSPHQVSRDGAKQAEKRKPTPHILTWDLAESARAERDANMILWILRNPKLKAARQVLLGCAKSRGSDTIPHGFKLMEDYGSAFLGNLVEEEQAPQDEDFDEV